MASVFCFVWFGFLFFIFPSILEEWAISFITELREPEGICLLFLRKIGNKNKKTKNTSTIELPALVRKTLVKITPEAIPGVERKETLS